MASYTKRVTKTKGTVWDVRAWFEDEGARRQVKLSGFATKKEAQKAIHDYFYGTKEMAAGKEVSFAEAYKAYKEAKSFVMAESSMYTVDCTMRKHVLPYFAGRDICLTGSDIVEWRDMLWNKTNEKTGRLYSTARLGQAWRVFHTFMEWARERYGVSDPFDGVKMPRRREVKKEMNVWTAEEFDKFISVVKNPMYGMFFRLLFYSGARKGEISALTVNDVVKCGNGYSIKISKTTSQSTGRGTVVTPPKTESSNRTVTLPECLTKELDEYLDGKEGYLFGGDKPISTTAYNVAFDTAIKKAGVKRIRVHDLRHSHASILIAAGVPVTAVAKRLGHASPKITLDVYSHCLDKSDDEIISVLNALPVGGNKRK